MSVSVKKEKHGDIILGLHISQAIAVLQHNVESIKEVYVSYGDQVSDNTIHRHLPRLAACDHTNPRVLGCTDFSVYELVLILDVMNRVCY